MTALLCQIRNSFKLLAVLILALVACSCGGGGGGGGGGGSGENLSSSGLGSLSPSQEPENDSEPEQESQTTHSELTITKDNAREVISKASDSAAAIILLSTAAQDAIEEYLLSDQETFEYRCRRSGHANVETISDAVISVSFEGCSHGENYTEEVFDGVLEFSSDEFFFNSLGEVYISGRFNTKASIKMEGGRFSEFSGAFSMVHQSTWLGDTMEILSVSNSSMSLTTAVISQYDTVTVKGFSAAIEYDSDTGQTSGYDSIYYGGFSIDLHSDKLGGRYSCDFSDPVSGLHYNDLSDSDLHCSGRTDKALKLSGTSFSFPSFDFEMLLLNTDTQSYEPIGTHQWGDYRSLFRYSPKSPSIANRNIQTVPSSKISIALNDAVYSDPLDSFYVTVTNSSSEHRNLLLEVDAKTGETSKTLELPGEGGKLAISADGLIAYVGYTDLSKVQRIELETLTLSTSLELGTAGFDLDPLYALDIAISPAFNDIVAIAPYYSGGLFAFNPVEIKLFKGSEELPVTGAPAFSRPHKLVFTGGGEKLYTYESAIPATTSVFKVSDSGAEWLIDTDSFGEGATELYVVGDALYHGNGSVFNAELGQLFGLNNTDTSYYGYDAARNQAALVTPDGNYTYMLRENLEVYDNDRFTLLGSIDPQVEGDFLRLINTGETGFAIVTNSGIHQFQHEDMPVTWDKKCESFQLRDLRVDISIQAFDCFLNDAVYREAKDEIIASTPSLSGVSGNSIVIFDAKTLALKNVIPVGSEPTDISLSASQNLVYVAYEGTNKYSVVNLDTDEVENNVYLGTAGLSRQPVFAEDIAPFPTDDNSAVISKRTDGNYRGTSVYTNGIESPVNIVRDKYLLDKEFGNRIQFVDSNRILGYNTDYGAGGLFEYSVDTGGIVKTDSYPEGYRWGFPNEIEYSQGRLYSSQGFTIDAESLSDVGQFGGLETDNFHIHQFAIDHDRGVAYYYTTMLSDGNDPSLKIFSLDSFEEVATVKMPSWGGMPDVKALLNISDDRLFVVLESFSFIIDKDEIQPIN